MMEVLWGMKLPAGLNHAGLCYGSFREMVATTFQQQTPVVCTVRMLFILLRAGCYLEVAGLEHPHFAWLLNRAGSL